MLKKAHNKFKKLALNTLSTSYSCFSRKNGFHPEGDVYDIEYLIRHKDSLLDFLFKYLIMALALKMATNN